MSDIRAEIWARLDELMAVQPGWLDGEGTPPSPAVAAAAAGLAETFTQWAAPGPLRLYPTPEGGIELEWDDDNLNHTIVIGPDLRLNLQTTDRNKE
ncbi:hypothetical protein [Kitasatospora sp. NPDC127116]|uniref:hypothetical protein n=1 Tax=Kitasatospora sp. NPDC127116 TaxID=3345367 RepID=UPI0036430DD5